MRLPRLTGREVLKILLKNGFAIRNISGSHVILYGFVKGIKRRPVVPVHANQELPIGTLLSVIEQAGFTKDEFLLLFQRKS